jgi:hypothetical protein
MKIMFIAGIFAAVLVSGVSNFRSANNTCRTSDTLYVKEMPDRPVFDGNADDECWENTNWYLIDHVWMPWGALVDSADFYGRFKIGWSSADNLLYFLIEVTDDVESDAYLPGKTAPIFNFDMFEIFIDEDRSGGYHVFDGKADNEDELGLNSENAFAYHILTPFPEDQNTTKIFYAEDLAGPNWENAVSCDYRNHFPDFVCRKQGNIHTWELSLLVFNDKFSDDNPGISRVKLTLNKVLGISLAWNDDDEPDINPLNTVRDNFIGSVAVGEKANNDHWKKADDFQIAKLVGPLSNW